MKWKKLGKIFDVDNIDLEWMNSHASVPFCEEIDSVFFKVYFSSRDTENKSNIGSFILNMETFEVSNISKKPLLKKGNLGAFDDSGIMGSCLLKVKDKKYLYYIGWNLGVTVPFRNSIGIAIENVDGEFNKLFEGPILDRTKEEPYFCASNCTLFDEGKYKMWYLSCVKWEKIEKEIRHFYHLKYTESEDGINWKRPGIVAIDFESEYEYAISVPRVIKKNGKYKMWFSSRATEKYKTYRIRYAESSDGKNWQRKKEIELDISESGWDSEMVCYPFVFEYKEKLYMLYNGNGYGKTGIGLAVLEEE